MIVRVVNNLQCMKVRRSATKVHLCIYICTIGRMFLSHAVSTEKMARWMNLAMKLLHARQMQSHYSRSIIRACAIFLRQTLSSNLQRVRQRGSELVNLCTMLVAGVFHSIHQEISDDFLQASNKFCHSSKDLARVCQECTGGEGRAALGCEHTPFLCLWNTCFHEKVQSRSFPVDRLATQGQDKAAETFLRSTLATL